MVVSHDCYAINLCKINILGQEAKKSAGVSATITGMVAVELEELVSLY